MPDAIHTRHSDIAVCLGCIARAVSGGLCVLKAARWRCGDLQMGHRSSYRNHVCMQSACDRTEQSQSKMRSVVRVGMLMRVSFVGRCNSTTSCSRQKRHSESTLAPCPSDRSASSGVPTCCMPASTLLSHTPPFQCRRNSPTTLTHRCESKMHR
jgi:hypothetical protein